MYSLSFINTERWWEREYLFPPGTALQSVTVLTCNCCVTYIVKRYYCGTYTSVFAPEEIGIPVYKMYSNCLITGI